MNGKKCRDKAVCGGFGKGCTVMFFRTGMRLLKFNALQAAADGRTAVLTKKSDNSLSIPCGEKTSRCASSFHKGSLTVEAALVFPLAVFALTAFLYLFFLLQVRTEIGRALTDAGRELSQMACVSEDAGSLAPSALAMLYGKREVENYLEGRMAAEIINGGSEGISFLGTFWEEETSTLTLQASFQVVFPPGIAWFHPIQVTQKRIVRGFTGFSGREGDPEIEDSSLVYVTDHGTVYHRDLSCRYLKLSVRQTELDKVDDLRSGDGSRYYPCERCWEEGAEIVFLTEEGNRYHQTLNCSSLVRGIHTVRLWDTGGLPPCSVCGG